MDSRSSSPDSTRQPSGSVALLTGLCEGTRSLTNELALSLIQQLKEKIQDGKIPLEGTLADDGCLYFTFLEMDKSRIPEDLQPYLLGWSLQQSMEIFYGPHFVSYLTHRGYEDTAAQILADAAVGINVGRQLWDTKGFIVDVASRLASEARKVSASAEDSAAGSAEASAARWLKILSASNDSVPLIQDDYDMDGQRTNRRTRKPSHFHLEHVAGKYTCVSDETKTGICGQVTFLEDSNKRKVAVKRQVVDKTGDRPRDFRPLLWNEVRMMDELNKLGLAPAIEDAWLTTHQSSSVQAGKALQQTFAYTLMESLLDTVDSLDDKFETNTDIEKGIIALVVASLGHGYVHNDIKGNNVGIAADGTMKLIDFGRTVYVGDMPDELKLLVAGYQLQYLLHIYKEPLEGSSDKHNFRETKALIRKIRKCAVSWSELDEAARERLTLKYKSVKVHIKGGYEKLRLKIDTAQTKQALVEQALAELVHSQAAVQPIHPVEPHREVVAIKADVSIHLDTDIAVANFDAAVASLADTEPELAVASPMQPHVDTRSTSSNLALTSPKMAVPADMPAHIPAHKMEIPRQFASKANAVKSGNCTQTMADTGVKNMSRASNACASLACRVDVKSLILQFESWIQLARI